MKIMLSDWHLAPFRAEKFLTQEKNLIESIIQFFAKRFENKKKEEKILKAMSLVVEKVGIEVGFFNGDFMESRRTERGMNTPEDLAMACQLRSFILRRLGLKNGEFNLGNHESGYNLPLGTDLERGINSEAIRNFLIFSGRKELYHSFCADDVRIIFVPYIFSEENARDFDLSAEKIKFLERMEQDLEENVPIIILVHDPDSFDDSRLLDLIRRNKEKIKFIFYGHYHSWVNLFFVRILIKIYSAKWPGVCKVLMDMVFLKLAKGNKRIVKELGSYFRKRKNIPSVIKELGAILIPAPSGIFGIGAGYLVLDIERGIVKKHRL